ncbi:hypothetical protein [Halogeometricum limi]|uniref:Uncharacterized protein n=1 Tax=Halogeometricum limi TaxID=555875 RepID=A0A1I6G031_9EURY|nr:hypothetical protein [Halogeometricum limi]SFR35583.1 hypothetical protein SAMN04488124_0640 [Halogeometricum limi]
MSRHSPLRRLRETGPVGLVPLAWGFAAAAHLRILDDRAVLVGHLVMATVLFFFAVLSWSEMRTHPVLRAWLAVVSVGFSVTLVGAYALFAGDETLAALVVLGWMVLPTLALLYTGRLLPREERAWAYTVGGAVSGVGALAFAAGVAPVVALALAGLGQTLGIVVAVVEY